MSDNLRFEQRQRAENKRKELEAEIERLRAVILVLRNELDTSRQEETCLHNELDRRIDENERLRAAGQRLLSILDGAMFQERHLQEARAALEGKDA